MIKPGSKDKKVDLLISGVELSELKRMAWQMSESFGLDARIENCRGKRPIWLYRWDFECLLAMIDNSLKNSEEYPDNTTSGYKAIMRLSGRLLDKYQKVFGI
jgi:hypothetical protein